MPRFASIDVGSNASRLLIVESTSPTDIRIVFQDRMPVRMGHEVFLTGKLDAQSLRQCLSALSSFAKALQTHRVEHLRAVVTASARYSDNAEELLQNALNLGIKLESIDGTEEARLVKLAVEKRLPLTGKRALLCDLGGGSLELSEVNHDEVRFSTSLTIGTVRLLESFLSAAPVSAHEETLLTEYMERVLQPIQGNFLKRSFDLVAGTGGNFDAIAALCPGLPVFGRPSIDVRKARALLTQLKRLRPIDRRARYGLKPDRADVIVPALYVLLAIADLARTDVIVAPGVGLKEGLIFDLVARFYNAVPTGLDEHSATRSAVQLGRRYHFDEPHATQVDRLAVQLFDQMKTLHRMTDDDRTLLRVAALTHDVGDFVNSESHHKHTEYILEHSDVMGLSADQRRVVGAIARYHRRAMPSTKHTTFKKLTPIERLRVRKLASILRLADALDRGHRSKVHHLEVKVEPTTVVLSVNSRDDLSLEAWTVEQKSELFRKTFRRKVKVVS